VEELKEEISINEHIFHQAQVEVLNISNPSLREDVKEPEEEAGVQENQEEIQKDN